MTTEPITASTDWSLARAVSAMDQVGINRVPVVDTLGYRPVGILTRDDVLRVLARRPPASGRAAPRWSRTDRRPGQPHQVKGRSSGILMRRPVMVRANPHVPALLAGGPGVQGQGPEPGQVIGVGDLGQGPADDHAPAGPGRLVDRVDLEGDRLQLGGGVELDPGSVRNTTRS